MRSTLAADIDRTTGRRPPERRIAPVWLCEEFVLFIDRRVHVPVGATDSVCSRGKLLLGAASLDQDHRLPKRVSYLDRLIFPYRIQA